MKPISCVVAIAILFQGSALAQTWLKEVEANRKAEEAREESLGIDAESVLGGFPLNDLRGMIGEGEDPGAWATFGPPARSDRRGRWLRDLLDDVNRLGRLSVEFRFLSLRTAGGTLGTARYPREIGRPGERRQGCLPLHHGQRPGDLRVRPGSVHRKAP